MALTLDVQVLEVGPLEPERLSVGWSPWLELSKDGGRLQPHFRILSATWPLVAVGYGSWRLLGAVVDVERRRMAGAVLWLGIVAVALIEGNAVIDLLGR